MPADGYFRTPRRLLSAPIAPDRAMALLWIVSQASYAEREVDGVRLRVGETPPIPASGFEKRFRWTRKTARVFLDYVLSERCAEETGFRIKVGQQREGPAKGPYQGPAKGPTYVVRLHAVNDSEGPAKGPYQGPAKGPLKAGEGEKKVEKKDTPLPSGEDAGASKQTGRRGQRGTKIVPQVNGDGMTANVLIGAWIKWRQEQGLPRPTAGEISKQGAFAARICRDHPAEHIIAAFAGIQTLTPHGPPFDQPWDLGTLREKFTRARDNMQNHPAVRAAQERSDLDTMLEGL